MWFWQALSLFGDVQFWVGAVLVSLVFLFTVPKRMRKHVAWFTFLVSPAVALGYMISHGLKILFKVPRPCLGLSFCPTTYSFPSGHATVVFAAMTTLALHYKDKRLGIFLFVLASVSAFSRLMMNVHTLEDVVFGSIIGIVIGILVQRAYRNYQEKIEGIVLKFK